MAKDEWQKKGKAGDVLADAVRARLIETNSNPFALNKATGVRLASIYGWLSGKQAMPSPNVTKIFTALKLRVVVDE